MMTWRVVQVRWWLAAGLVLGGASACKKPEEAAPQAAQGKVRPEGMPRVQVATADVESGEVSRTMDLAATLVADTASNVTAQVPGVVLEVNADVGDNVKKGDVLVRLDDRDARMRVQAAQASVMQARARLGLPLEGDIPLKAGTNMPDVDIENIAEVRAARAGVALAQSDHERNKKLAADGAVSPAMVEASGARFDQAQSQLDAARSGMYQAIAGLLAAEAQLSMARKAASDMTIRAPYQGAVLRRSANVGEYAMPQMPLMAMVATEKLRLLLDVPESAITVLQPGMDVTFTVPGQKDTFTGKLARISPSVDQNSRSLRAEAMVDNKDGRLKAGMFVAARVVLSGREMGLFVPRAAVVTQSGLSKVFVLQGDHVEERIVTVGEKRPETLEIRGEIKPGEKVVTRNVDKLTDGAPVDG